MVGENMILQTFEFATAGRILFGFGTASQIGSVTGQLGSRALVVTGRSRARVQPILDQLQAVGVAATVFQVAGEPTFDDVTGAVAVAREARADVILGFGGGSAIDTAKAVAALVTNSGELLDYVEVIGRGRQLSAPPLPCVAVPTTAGTGAEVTKNSVLLSPTHRVKVSLRHSMLLPRVAIVDPELTMGLPPEVTARTGCDALTQLIEAFVSVRANPMVDALCRAGLQCVARALRRAVRDGTDRAARYDMALASMLSGIALANAGLGAVHGLAGPVGGFTGIPHGAVCAALLPHVMRMNIARLETGQYAPARLDKYREIACILTGCPDASPADGVAWVAALVSEFGLARIQTPRLTPEAIRELASQAMLSSSTRSNPVGLSLDQLVEVLSAAVD